MRLEGTLDAFSLPDIFALLSLTSKTGALRLRRPLPGGGTQQGVVHVRGGAVTGARSDLGREQLARRMLSTGLVDDEALAQAAEVLAEDPAAGLPRLLAERGDVAAEAARTVAADHITDSVFDLMRWPDGEFAFLVDEPDPDDLGAEVALDAVVAEGRRRLQEWPAIAEQVPPADAVLRLNPVPPPDTRASAQEWALLALADGRRTVAELVALAGRGEYAVVTALAALVDRGVLVAGDAGDDQLVRRHLLLSALEGVPVAAAAPADDAVAVPAQPTAEAAAGRRGADAQPAAGGAASGDRDTADVGVIPSRPEPFTAPRRPEHPEESLVLARSEAATVTSIGGHGVVNGATAMQPDPAPAGLVERDPSVNKSLLLRLIAGVRGL